MNKNIKNSTASLKENFKTLLIELMTLCLALIIFVSIIIYAFFKFIKDKLLEYKKK
jgi:hypothetical protein